MNRKYILPLLVLLLVSCLSYQRSLLTHYSYQTSDLRRQKTELYTSGRLLGAEIRRLASPEILHQYWLEHCSHLGFPNYFKVESDELVAKVEHP